MANTFSLILVLVTVVTGIIWALEKWVWAKQRQQKIEHIQSQTQNIDLSLTDRVLPQPW
ncbi:hypothetical protein P4S72_22560 [Vibrio sp. PP-XX7]